MDGPFDKVLNRLSKFIRNIHPESNTKWMKGSHFCHNVYVCDVIHNFRMSWISEQKEY